MGNKLALLISVITLGSCSYILDIKRSGEIKKTETPWNGASSIEVWTPCKLVLVNSENPFMEVEGMDFIVDGYDLIQSDDKLVIEHKNTNWLQEEKIANITLGASDFKRVTFNSPGKITTRDTLSITQLQIVVNGKGIYTTSHLILKGDNFSLSVYGGVNKSSHHLSGELRNAQYNMEGGTDIDALELKTKKVSVILKSYGNIFLNATEKLTGKIYSTGNIYYSGDPNVEVEIVKNSVMQASGKTIRY
ncbi:MAG TPA: DUF2807 domain-containing protein [Marinilabiliaceae bacterium]|nr:DUF2807 domain-containing protein [Marinilabiliaceae bacterium]